MKLKSIILIGIIIILASIVILLVVIVNKKSEKKELPVITLTDIFQNKSHTLTDNYGQFTIILFFDPECDLCKDKVILLSENCNLLKNTRLFMISVAPKEAIISFFTDNNININICNNIFIISAFEEIISNKFEYPIFPSIYIYNEKNVLIKKFNYSVKIDEIINSTRNK